MIECGCEVRKGVRADSGWISGADVSDTERGAEAGFMKDAELEFRQDKRQEIIALRCSPRCVMLGVGTGNCLAKME